MNRYANLPGPEKVKDTYNRINTGFDAVQADMDAEVAAREDLDERVDTIIQGGGPDKDPELVDIRTPDPSYTPGRTIAVAGDLTRDVQAQFMSHKADNVQDAGGVHGLKIESGVWTPSLIFEQGSIPNTSTDGRYYKVGKLVYVMCRIFTGTKSADASGYVRVTGLPFAVANVLVPSSLAISRMTNILLDADMYDVTLLASANNNFVQFLSYTNQVDDTAFTTSNIKDYFSMDFSGFYYTDS